MTSKHRNVQNFKPPSVARILEDLPGAVALSESSGRITYCNRAFRTLFGLGKSASLPITADLIGSNFGSSPQQNSIAGPGTSQTMLLRKSDGSEFWGQVSVAGAADNKWVILVADIDKLKRDHDTLDYREKTWRNAISEAQHGVWDYYSTTDTVFLSDEWKELRGIDRKEEVVKCTAEWADNIHPDDYDKVMECNRKNNVGELESFSYEYRERRRDGKWIWIYSRGRAVERDENNIPTRVVGIDVDVTGIKEDEERRLQEIERTYQRHLEELETANRKVEAARKKASIISNQDVLTGLANRRAFSTQLSEITGVDGRETAMRRFFLFLIDLDRFKPINDTYGHNAGDAVICETAARIKSALSENAIVARLGGDEFGVILPCLVAEREEEYARLAAEEIIRAIREPIHLDNVRLDIGASIGISRYPECGTTESLLLRRADIAMYEAKKDEKTGIVFFAPWMERKVISKAKLEADVRDSVLKQQFVPYFQPIVDLSNNELHGFEVLARWDLPEQKHIGPGIFIPIIEQYGLMPKFGVPMLQRTFASARDWGHECKIAFNITANGICNQDVCSTMLEIMDQEAFPAERFIVEVSEMAMVKDIEAASLNMNLMRDKGVVFALDDFGVGYSGLSYLRTLSFEILKLDRSFVSTLMECDQSQKIVHTVLTLAEQFGMKTVAEGIETDEIVQQVRSAGFNYGQGYFFEKPVSAETANELVHGKRQIPLQAG